MNLSKIGSKNTYHKCIKELHDAKYIYYHPALSKFLPVKVSIGRLDIEEEPPSRYKQLDIFNSSEEQSMNPAPDLPCPKIGTDETDQNLENTCPKFDTDSVPYLTATCPKNDTVPVPKMGHNIKHKHFIKESKQPAQKIFDKNEKLSEAVNKLAGVPNSVHDTEPGRSAFIPTLSEVEEFFKSTNYPEIEANKFFNHYKAIGWKIKGITPITDWQASAHKWMINAGKFENKKTDQLPTHQNDMESLYKQFIAGNNVFKHITPEHFAELKLELSDEVLKHARQERINQLTGSNQNSILQLLQAYLNNKENDPLLIKDQETLDALAKRIAVIHHFNRQKQSSFEVP